MGQVVSHRPATTPGLLTVTARVTARNLDNLEEVSREARVQVVVNFTDAAPPVFKVTQPVNVRDSANGFILTVRASAMDAVSGLDRIQWSLNGAGPTSEPTPRDPGTWLTWTKEIFTTAVGVNRVTLRCYDKAGFSTEVPLTVETKDTTAPTYEILEPIKNAKIPFSDKPDAFLAVQGRATDLQSGMDVVQWKLDAGPFTDSTLERAWPNWRIKVPMPAVGSHTLTLLFRDKAGNTATSTPIDLEVMRPFKPRAIFELS